MSKNVLTPKQRIFVQEYLVAKNATQSAKIAGYSTKTAYSQGQRLLKNVEIAEAVEKGLKKQASKAELASSRVLEEIANIAFAELSSTGPSSKLRALELLGKHFGLFADKLKVTNECDTPQVVLYLPRNGSEVQVDPEKTS